MINKNENTIYYISDLEHGFVNIIDGDSYHIIKKINIGQRPQNIVVDEKKKIYIASDRNNKVTLINDLYDIDKIFNFPNNGNIQIDCINNRIYVANTEEVSIYDLTSEKRIKSITGFMAADCLKLDKNKEKLFVLDILQNEIKVYDTFSLKLINVYKNIGMAPKYMILDDNEDYIYIANKHISKRSKSGEIAILEIESGNISWIALENGSIITDLQQKGLCLYAANIGLHRIEVINIVDRKSIGIIKTSLPEVEKIKLSNDKKILICTSKKYQEAGAIDKVDTISNSIIDTFEFDGKECIPYDIAIVKEENIVKGEIEFKDETEIKALTQSEESIKKSEKYQLINVIMKRVISRYEEKVIFNNVETNILDENRQFVKADEVKFRKCRFMNDTRTIKNIENKMDYCVLEYEYYIPYCIRCIDINDESYTIEGKMIGMQKASLYIPDFAEQQGVEFRVNSFTELISPLRIVENHLQFDASALISTKVVIDEETVIADYKSVANLDEGRSESDEQQI